MKYKKLTSLSLALILGGTLLYHPQHVEAIDFSKDESKYMNICSSSNLSSSNKSTCEQFNKYLKKKNQELNKQLATQKETASKTKDTVDSISKKITNINSSISQKETEIAYVEGTISNLEQEIAKNDQIIKDRMYSMQTYMNEDSYLEYIFGADNFADLFSRIDSFNELTLNDQELIAEMANQKKEISKQKATLQSAKTALLAQKEEQANLQTRYTALLQEQNKNVAATQESANYSSQQVKQMDEALNAFYENSKNDNIGYVEPLPTPPSTPNNNNNSNNNQNNNNNNSNNNQNNNQGGNSQSDASTGVRIANAALSKQGCRYWWGASGPNYFDCSGLVYWACNQAGVKIGRTTAAGYSAYGKAVLYNNLQVGDVITFTYDGHFVAHIGIYIGNGRMVEASGQGSGTVGQYPEQRVKVTSVAPGSYFYRHIYNCRRLY